MISNSCYYWRVLCFSAGKCNLQGRIFLKYFRTFVYITCQMTNCLLVWGHTKGRSLALIKTLVQFCRFLSYLLWTVIPVNLINHDVVSHDTLFNWSVLSVYLWWGSGAVYCYPKPNPKSVSEEEELQKFKLNKGTEWVLKKKKGKKDCFEYRHF